MCGCHVVLCSGPALKPGESFLGRAGPSSSGDPRGCDVPTRGLYLRNSSTAPLCHERCQPPPPPGWPCGTGVAALWPLAGLLTCGACHPEPGGMKSGRAFFFTKYRLSRWLGTLGARGRGGGVLPSMQGALASLELAMCRCTVGWAETGLKGHPV